MRGVVIHGMWNAADKPEECHKVHTAFEIIEAALFDPHSLLKNCEWDTQRKQLTNDLHTNNLLYTVNFMVFKSMKLHVDLYQEK